MKKTLFVLLMAATLVLGVGIAGVVLAEDHGQQDPLIDRLIRKGILTEQEGVEIQKEEAKDKGLVLPKGLRGIKVGMLAYIDYSNGVTPESHDSESSYNHFRLTRGYLTVKKELLPWMHTRITIDTHQDDTGDYKERIKYLYAELRPPDLGPFTDMKSEIGIGHIPWLDFEEHINLYRCQGTMAVERAGTFNSADAGVSLRGYLGGKLEDAEENTGSHYYDGRHGSWHLGVYNGAGYHAKEVNNNKVVEGRLTWRVLPDLVPGLQLSYFGKYGEGNDKDSTYEEYPDYMVNLGMLSYEHPWVVLTGQYFQTEGNAKGKWVDTLGKALATEGYSCYANVKLPVLDRKLSVIARYDYFDQDSDDKLADASDYEMYIGGLAWDVYKGNMLLVMYEQTDYGKNAGKKGKLPEIDNRLGDDHKVQVVWQIKF